MNSKIFLFFFICFIFLFLKSLLVSLFHLSILFVIFAIVSLVLYTVRKDREKYQEYDYEKEYESAIIHGKIIGGTVFASYPENSPGLGWIL